MRLNKFNIMDNPLLPLLFLFIDKPEIDYCLSSEKNVTSFSGNTIYLRCVARGVPLPNVTWYRLSGKTRMTGTTSYPGESELALTTTQSFDYGMYRCRAENTIGSAWHNITVVQILLCKY
jgi:hypothetical protein